MYIYIQKGWWGSSSPACSDSARIHIHIKNPGEKIYYGFNTWLAQPPNMVLTYVRMLSPIGTVLQQDTMAYAGTGWIMNYAQAVAGPNVINPAGYPGFEFTPPSPGDYMLDIGYGDPLEYGQQYNFDITVIDTTSTPWHAIDGRVYCYSWSFQVQSGFGFNGTMFCYPPDSVVSSIYFNGLLPLGDLFLTMNRNGLYAPPAKWVISRMSRVSMTGWGVYKEYKIFLNDPDSTVYPTGILGEIMPGSLTVTPHCNGTVDFGMAATKSGQVEIQIQIDPDPNIQPIDVMISDSVHSGMNTLTWDGTNGLGQPVANGTPFYIRVKYLNGLTNMPFDMISGCPLGFIVQLQRPQGPTPLIYWDDRNIDTSQYNFAGCLGVLPSTGCHSWSGAPPYSHSNVINSWWYTSAGSLSSGFILFKRSFLNTSDTTICQGDTVMFHGQPFMTQGSHSVIYPTITGCDSTFTLNLTLKPGPPLNLGPNVSACNGQSHTFDAGWCNTCTYVWADLTTHQMNIGTGQTFTTSQAGTYMVTKTDYTGCSSRDTVVLITGNTPSITNTVYNFTICSGSSTNLTLTANYPGTVFHWVASLLSGNITGMSNDSGTAINQTLVNHLSTPGMVKYTVTPVDSGCAGVPKDFLFTVSPTDTVKITISTLTNPVCAGISVTFIATPTNGGTTPAYLWKVNGGNAGTNSPIYTFIPNNNDIVTCKLTSSELCTSNNPASSNPVTMTVNPNLPVSVSITASSNPFCIGNLVTFTAVPTNEGITPSYQWKVNGSNVGINSPIYSYNPISGDIVKCVLTSSVSCPIGNPATSNSITMTGNLGLPAGVSIVANPNPFCPGSSVTFTATPSNGGTSPAYQWKVNGNNTGTNLSTYSYTPANNDSVRCIMTSNLACVSGNPATSNKIILSGNLTPVVTFTRCFDSVTTVNAKPIKLKGGIPLGGTYTGPGVNSGYFYPNLAGTGTKTIIYSYTNSALCSATSSLSIINYQLSIFNCGSQLIDIRDSKVYPTVQIGSQCWMAANLNYGTEIPSTQHQRDNCIPENYKSAVGSQQSGFYQWDELMRYDDTPGQQGLCPPGWHVPTEAEWNTLFTNWTNNAFAGAPLKYSGFSGFNALLSGVRHQSVQWNYQNFATFFWSSTPDGTNKAWSHGMNDYDYSVSLYPSFRSNAFSVRCMKDN